MEGRQDKAYKILWHLNQTERNNLKVSSITEKEWLRYYEWLWTQEQLEETEFGDINECVDPVAMDEVSCFIMLYK